jgi:predicted dehydrogenase
MGSVHYRNLVRSIPEAELVALCDIPLEVAQAVAAELGIQRVVTLPCRSSGRGLLGTA